MSYYNSNTEIKNLLEQYLSKFMELHNSILKDKHYIDALEALVDDYSRFIVNTTHKQQYETWEDEQTKSYLTHQLQNITALCVKQVEIIRARRFLEGKASHSGYFNNVEHCIEEEFGQWQITNEDKLLLVGAGAYPMTLIQVAKKTGASVIGIDIDSQAVDLAQRIVKILAPNEDIEITEHTVDQVQDIKDVTHVIFSSTVPIKYDILDELYALTNEDIVVAMRYGDGIKKLFNFPSQSPDANKWHCVDKRIRPYQIFDIAFYKKAAIKVGVKDA